MVWNSFVPRWGCSLLINRHNTKIKTIRKPNLGELCSLSRPRNTSRFNRREKLIGSLKEYTTLQRRWIEMTNSRDYARACSRDADRRDGKSSIIPHVTQRRYNLLVRKLYVINFHTFQFWTVSIIRNIRLFTVAIIVIVKIRSIITHNGLFLC